MVVVGAFSYRLGKDRLAAEVYRDRLVALQGEHGALIEQYNRAVKRTAVTELDVTRESVSVTVRTAEGVLKTVATPYDPSGEVFLDYVVVGGRLWIRRVFDEHTPPNRGVVIDPALAEIDWTDPEVDHGKAAYRALSPGRWRLAVSGDGALTLRRIEGEGDEDALVSSVEVREFEPVEEADRAIERITFVDVLRGVFGE